MDLLEVLRARVDSLPNGDHTAGLRAVVQHVQVAVAHLERGKHANDETAFTDAIYRTNQAFEGSLKEAYRVLASRDPQKVRPFDIEKYFQEEASLRPRVLTQFTRYRQEWRNPATHDYRLDFDEDEALLAIVSVSAFAIVLADQISETLSFAQARAAAQPIQRTADASQSLVDQVAEALLGFHMPATAFDGRAPREAEIVGALWGYLVGTLPGIQVAADAVISPESGARADLLVTLREQRLLVEVKRYSPALEVEDARRQVEKYMMLSGVPEGLLYFFDDAPLFTKTRTEFLSPSAGRIVVVGPEPHRVPIAE